jgi:hypothetical protein
MDLYCVLCGERLNLDEESLTCLGCDARYDSVLLSETKVEEEGRVVTELSLSMDFYVVKEKGEAPLMQAVNCYSAVEATS